MRIRQRGFTLIEIMVVVVILSVLGALVVPQIIDKVDVAQGKARTKRYSCHSNRAWTCTGWIISNIRRPSRGCRRWSNNRSIPPSPTITRTDI